MQERTAFGQPIGSFQNTRFVLAEVATEVEIGQAFIDQCVLALNAGELTAEEASMAKWWCTEMLGRVTDTCVQLHGGYGYMTEYPVARAWADARITRIYGGTTELQTKTVDRGVQVFGGYGYMREYPIARAFLDSRVQTIYGGTTEIMKEIIGKSLGF